MNSEAQKHNITFRVETSGEPLDEIQIIAETLKTRGMRLIMMHIDEMEPGLTAPFLLEPAQISDIYKQSLEDLKNMLNHPESLNLRSYSTSTLQQMFPGITKENIYYWEKKGFISPEKVTRGSRSARKFNVIESIKVGLMGRYTHGGLNLDTAAQQSFFEIQRLTTSCESSSQTT